MRLSQRLDLSLLMGAGVGAIGAGVRVAVVVVVVVIGMVVVVVVIGVATVAVGVVVVRVWIGVGGAGGGVWGGIDRMFTREARRVVVAATRTAGVGLGGKRGATQLAGEKETAVSIAAAAATTVLSLVGAWGPRARAHLVARDKVQRRWRQRKWQGLQWQQQRQVPRTRGRSLSRVLRSSSNSSSNREG